MVISMAERMVQVSELDLFTTEDEPILKKLSFSLDEGELKLLTKLDKKRRKLILGLLIGEIDPTAGQILLVGRNVVRIGPEKKRLMLQEDVGFVPEDFSLPNRKVFDCLAFKAKALDLSYETEVKINETLEQLSLRTQVDYRTEDLTPTGRVKLAIGLAVLNRPKLLICDHLLTGLEEDGRKKLLYALKDLHQRRGLTILLAEEGIGRISEGEDDLPRLKDIELEIKEGTDGRYS